LNHPPEPWLRGIDITVDPVIGHLLRSTRQIREDLAGIPVNNSAVAFHLKHLARSTDRLCTYLEGHQLNEQQLTELQTEHEPGGDLLTAIHQSLDRYDKLIRTLTPAQFSEVREIGRQRLQTTAIGLAIHIAEHGQRHTGQALSLSKCSTES
jgi:uncharacterized damage-inducible protein DinB